MSIKNYNSTFSLSKYKVGNAYAFYVHSANLDKFVKADEKTIEKHSPIISEIINDKSFDIENDGRWLALTRVIGVVVDKHKATDSKDIDKITVMFKTDDGGYVLQKFAVGYHNVAVNGQDFVRPAAVLGWTSTDVLLKNRNNINKRAA